MDPDQQRTARTMLRIAGARCAASGARTITAAPTDEIRTLPHGMDRRRHRARVRGMAKVAPSSSFMTRGHGRHLGLVRGGAGSRMRPLAAAGNSGARVWRARLDEHKNCG